jgi:adenosylcobinamide-GDP ribazoletransferase
MALAVGLFPYSRQEGLGSAFRQSLPIQITIAGIIAVVAAGLLGSTVGLILFGVATVLALLLGYGISRMLGGLTGDTYGAINELIEVALLLVAAGILPSLAMEPFWRGGF